MKKSASITQLKKRLAFQINTYILILRNIHPEINQIQSIEFLYPNDGPSSVQINAPSTLEQSSAVNYLIQTIEGYIRINKVTEINLSKIQRFQVIQLETKVGLQFY